MQHEIDVVIEKLKGNKGPGLDSVPAEFEINAPIHSVQEKPVGLF